MQDRASASKPAAFNWEDPFLLDDQLTEDERAIRDTARAYAQAPTTSPTASSRARLSASTAATAP